MGASVLGDQLYGRKTKRLNLESQASVSPFNIQFEHPVTGEMIEH